MIGFLMLMGIVAKNSILLVDFAIEEMRAGKDRLTAILEAGHKRARPIVMTTVAMVAGMLPVAHRLRRRQLVPRPDGDRRDRRTASPPPRSRWSIVPAVFTLIDDIERWLGAASSAACSRRSRRRQRGCAAAQPSSGGMRSMADRGLRPRQRHAVPSNAPRSAAGAPLGLVGAAAVAPAAAACCTALRDFLGWLAFRVFPVSRARGAREPDEGLSRARRGGAARR